MHDKSMLHVQTHAMKTLSFLLFPKFKQHTKNIQYTNMTIKTKRNLK